MFTGIVQALVSVESVEDKPGLKTFSVRLPEALADGVQTGASIAVNGVCFTVTRVDGPVVWFDAVKETLELTNIRYLQSGTRVNVARSF
ncbi:MAG: riboflavin synthase, partial [Pseudomonadales bacterium]|nr:riboflavin synthase [Pseudomonadales bacterium]